MVRRLSHICMLSLILLPGCMGNKQKYAIKPLEPLAQQESLIYKDSQENITIHVKALSDTECVDLFGERAIRIVRGKNPLTPLQISINNQTEYACLLNPKSIGLPVVPTKSAIRRLQNSPWQPILAGLGISIGVAAAIGGLLGFAYVCMLAKSYSLIGHIMITAVSIPELMLVCTPLCIILKQAPVHTENANIQKYIKKQCLGDSLVIDAGQSNDILVFVRKKDLKPSFKFNVEKIINMKTKEHEDTWFNVCLA